MQGEGKIATDSAWLAWEPEKALRSFTLNEIRFSKGFLQADFRQWFNGLKAHWLPLFHSLGADVEVQNVEPSLVFPDGLDRIVAFEIDNEPAVFGVAVRSEQLLVDVVAGGCEEKASDVLLEYLERRFLSSVTRTWSGAVPLNCCFSSAAASSEVEVNGVVHVELLVGGEPCEFWMGIGPNALERFDHGWREQMAREREDGMTHTLSIEIAELAVPPELLVDYLRSGTVIGLDLPVSNEALIRRDGEPWALGRIGQFNGRFAVQVVTLEPHAGTSDALTKLQVEIARVELDSSGLQEHAQPGAILLTRTPVSASATLVIGGEPVAGALVGELGGQFALNVVGK